MMNRVVEEILMSVNNDVEDFLVRSVREEAFKVGVSIEVNARKILEAVQKQIPKKPRKIETIYGVDGCGEVTNKLVLFTCPVCDEPIHVGRGCSNNKCRQAIDWSPEKQILKNAKVLKIPKPRIVGEEDGKDDI